jgi:hypothetical protein
MLELLAVPQMADLKRNVLLQQDGGHGGLPHWGVTERESLNTVFQTDILGGTDPSLPKYNPIGYFLLGLCKGPGSLSKVWSYG